jgi:hypothetical protein
MAGRLLSMDQRNSKVTAFIRVLLGASLLYQGWVHFGEPVTLGRALGLSLDGALWLAVGEFSLGLCLVWGILSRLCGLITLLGALALSVAIGPGVLSVMAGLGGLYLTLRGGGAYSTDRYIGQMQRRVSERELAREAARRSAELARSQD